MRRIAGVLPVSQVARLAICRKPVENSTRRTLVAILALHRGMPSQKWEAVLMILHLLRRDFPTLHRVALLAVGSQLAVVDVPVAIRARFPDIRKYRLHVAQRTFHVFVHSTQRIFRFVVIEFRYGADGPPPGGGVTVLAGDVQEAMRVATGLFLARVQVRRRNSTVRSGRLGGAGERQESPEQELEERGRKGLPPHDADTHRGGTIRDISECIFGGRRQRLLLY